MVHPRPPFPKAEWAYFCDIDGTLVAFAAHPDAVEIREEVRHVLQQLYASTHGAVALVSGRSLASIDALFHLPFLPAAGLHGLERREPDGTCQRVIDHLPGREQLLASLEALVARFPGLLLEDKGIALALHYRLTPRLGGYLSRTLKRLVAHFPEIALLKGKYVFELKPRAANKGEAIAAFMTTFPFRGRTPVFLGDDVTDEYGFERINQLNGVSIKVGPGKTVARFRLPDIEAVLSWLQSLTP